MATTLTLRRVGSRLFWLRLRSRSDSAKTSGIYGYAGVVVHRSSAIAPSLPYISFEAFPVDAGLREHVLHRRMINRVDFTHAQHVDAFGLEQPAHIDGKGRDDVAGSGDEKCREAAQMRAKRLWQALQGGGQAGGGVFTSSS
jgi:hypothetical protein